MQSSKGNENGEKTTIGLISKKATLHVQHTFLYISLPLFCMTKTWKFQKLPSYTFYDGNVVWVLVHFFFHCCSFSPLATSISYFLNATKNFSSCPSNKECLLCFLSLALALFHSFSHWASLGYHLHVLSLFLCLSLILCSKLWSWQ